MYNCPPPKVPLGYQIQLFLHVCVSVVTQTDKGAKRKQVQFVQWKQSDFIQADVQVKQIQ